MEFLGANAHFGAEAEFGAVGEAGGGIPVDSSRIDAAQEFAGTLGERVPHEISQTLDVAVANAARDAEASGLADAIVLLSPACASFDQYRNFEIRGARFRDLVMALPGVKPVV